MRTLMLALLVLAGFALVGFPDAPILAGDAAAVCGGGEPGEPCHCPDRIPILNKPLPIYC